MPKIFVSPVFRPTWKAKILK